MSPVDTREALRSLRTWVEAEGFKGYDPYDALSGRIDFRRFGKWTPIVATQIQKRNPLNVRSLLGIKKTYNSKALGLFLEAYSLLYAVEGEAEARMTAEWLFERLSETCSQEYSGACWGYPFDWASPVKYVPAGTPSSVVTGFVVRGMLQYYAATDDPRARDLIQSASNFVLQDLPRFETDEDCCFSYTPIMEDCCYNASLLAAETLAGGYAVSQDPDPNILSIVGKTVDFVVARQKEDGHWNYSVDLATGAERAQIDFHQGFILDSLTACIHLCDFQNPRYVAAVRKGAHFYRMMQFSGDGRAYWRLPKEWPTDIHHQAQGIISFTKLAKVDPAYDEFARTIARWTITHMMDDDGFFHYRKGRLLTNRIPYMRWGQAWMMLALCQLALNDHSRDTHSLGGEVKVPVHADA